MDTKAQSNYLDLPAGRFHYLSWGAERTELPSFLLLHGITSSALGWREIALALTDRYRVYAPDLRGHGESVKLPRGNYSLRQTADDVVGLMTELQLDRPVLLGHSWGGGITLFLASGAAAEQPAPSFAKIILEDPPCYFGDGTAQWYDPYVRNIGRPFAELRTELIANNPEWSELDLESKLDAISKVSRDAVISVFEQAAPEGYLFPLIAQLPPPVLLMRADPERDTVLPGEAWDLACQHLPPGSHAVQIAGASHDIHRTRPQEFLRVLNDFLDT